MKRLNAPAVQASPSALTEQRDTRFQPGVSGNPNGRPSAGSSVREWINKLAHDEATELQLRVIARDRASSWAKRTAAERMLRTLECGDIADYQDFMTGKKTLDELRAEGINTELIRRAKFKRRITETGCEDTGELELHDRSGVDFDRILDRTDGRARQTVELKGEGAMMAAPMIVIETLDTAHDPEPSVPEADDDE